MSKPQRVCINIVTKTGVSICCYKATATLGGIARGNDRGNDAVIAARNDAVIARGNDTVIK